MPRRLIDTDKPIHRMSNVQYFKTSAYIRNHMPEVESSIVERMDNTRRRLAIRIEDFADIIGCNSAAYYRITAGDRPPTLSEFLIFCYAFGFDVRNSAKASSSNTPRGLVRENCIALLEQLSPATLDNILTAIQRSDESAATIAKAEDVFQKLQETAAPAEK